MNKMLFETVLSGHRMEYIHHLYMEMMNHPEDNFEVVVAEEFNEKKSDYNWPKADNISFDFINQIVANNANSGNIIAQSWKKSRLLEKYIKKHKSQKVFLITLMKFHPFLSFFLSSDIKVISIIYKIYLYEWDKYPIIRKTIEMLKYKMMVWSRCLQTIFILNDEASARYLNRLYNTTKFQYLVDPYNEIQYTPRNIRNELNIPDGNKVFLHFGGLQQRKGTLEIIRAITLLSTEERKNITIIFAGKVYEHMRTQFYKELENVKKTCQIIVFDEFCSVEFLADLCYSCDQILIPYRVTAQSSGLLGYAAQFEKPVLGPNRGLIGKLIRKYNLGFTLTSVNATGIAEGIRKSHIFSSDNRYFNKMKVKTFTNQIFAHF